MGKDWSLRAFYLFWVLILYFGWSGRIAGMEPGFLMLGTDPRHLSQQGLEAYGIFKLGEIIGRRNLVGYNLKE